MAEPMNCPEPPQHPAGCQGWTQPLHCGLGRSPAALRPRVHTTHGGLERPPLELGHGAYELLLGKGEAEMLPVGFASRVIPEPRCGGGGVRLAAAGPVRFGSGTATVHRKPGILCRGHCPAMGGSAGRRTCPSSASQTVTAVHPVQCQGALVSPGSLLPAEEPTPNAGRAGLPLHPSPSQRQFH